jgi:nucleotide-binding universal stress UspA family protein
VVGYTQVMTTILIAIDQSDESHAAAASARRIFGEQATYLAINVAERPSPAELYAWGSVFGYPYPAVVPVAVDDSGDAEIKDAAEADAAKLASEAGLTGAQPIGEVGDPVEAICKAAVDHHVDVIVAGWHHRNWLSRMFEVPISDELIKRTSVPVLVVPTHLEPS